MVYVERLNITFPKPKRLPIGATPRKNIITQREMTYLFKHKLVIEEEMDGKPVKFITTKIHFFIFAADLKEMRETYYHIPGRYAIFDIFDPDRDLFLPWNYKFDLSMKIREGKIRIGNFDPLLFFPVPIIAFGKFEMEDLPQFLGVSGYAHNPNTRFPGLGKGIIVKSSADEFPDEYHPGKIVRKEFLGEKGWNLPQNPPRNNLIDPSKMVVNFILSDITK